MWRLSWNRPTTAAVDADVVAMYHIWKKKLVQGMVSDVSVCRCWRVELGVFENESKSCVFT